MITPRITQAWNTVKLGYAKTHSFDSYFYLVFAPLCWISRRESSDYTFATTAQMYVEF